VAQVAASDGLGLVIESRRILQTKPPGYEPGGEFVCVQCVFGTTPVTVDKMVKGAECTSKARCRSTSGPR
jgi:hypothetical protein